MARDNGKKDGGGSDSGGPRIDGGSGVDRVLINTSSCGNGMLDTAKGEQCDDNNTTQGDGCSPGCQIEADCACPQGNAGACNCSALCGDGKLASTEACDDGNKTAGDGCAADCMRAEAGYQCRVPGRRCVPLCGDGMKIGSEECDDGNGANDDGCSATCLLEPGASCTGTPSVCKRAACGNGMMEAGEACDKGRDNGLFFGDGSGCSKTCTREPTCRNAMGRNQACATTCGDGNREPDEACDDGNQVDGDGCSKTCTLEGGFTCSDMLRPDSEPCASGVGQCLKLPVVYRDFKNETQAGGHPDFFALGSTSAVAPTAGQLRSCIPNSGGTNRKQTSGDSTVRCWGIAQEDLLNGKPQFSRPTGAFVCPCQFTDWSANNGNHFPAPVYNFGQQSPIRMLPNNAGQPAPGWTSGVAGVTLVNSAATFNQWFNDSPASTKITNLPPLELVQIANTDQYQFSSAADTITGGFFPLDGVTAMPAEPRLCNLWPYWYAWPNCTGDQYLFPPTAAVIAPQGAWVPQVMGRTHNFYFTTEVHYLFVFQPPLSLRFYGDDDLFIYINGKLVLDLGGIHQRLPGQVTVGADGNAQVIEGGILNPLTGAIDFSYPDAFNPLMAHPLAPDADYRMRTVNLGLQAGRTYEIAVFHADRAPTESNYQLTLSGFSTNRSACIPRCGDGVTSGAEECDCGDGTSPMPAGCDSSNNSTTYGGCTTECKFGPYCGDGMMNGAEQCDLGTARNNSAYVAAGTGEGCTSSCQKPHYCGDAIVDAAFSEQCDHGPGNGMDGSCDAQCKIVFQ